MKKHSSILSVRSKIEHNQVKYESDKASMSNVKLFLLGTPYLEIDGQLVELQRRKLLALLSYLAVTDQRQSRDTLATLLWPNSGQSQARAALSRHLSELRKTMGEACLNADRDIVGLTEEVWLDVADFQQGVSHADRSDPSIIDSLHQAVALYRDHFLAGFTLPGCPGFDEWQFFQSEDLRQQFASALERLIALLAEQGQDEDAIPYARRWLALDPLHEPIHQHLMRLYAQTGQQAAALRQYQICVQTLDEALSVPPAEKTTALYEQIRKGRLNKAYGQATPSFSLKDGEVEPPPLVSQRAESASRLRQDQFEIDQNLSFLGAEGTDPTISKINTKFDPEPPIRESVAQKPLKPQHNLPVQTTSFIGRKQELAELAVLLADSVGRLITIVAPGGMGKTRLALEAASQYLAVKQERVYFVSLAAFKSPADLPGAIAKATDYTFQSDARSQAQQVLDFLQNKQMLLVLDNFEHLLPAADYVNDILQSAPEVKLLVTSRERLQLSGETVYDLGGMIFPEWETPADAGEYNAVQLFIQSAQRVRPNFDLQADDLTFVTRICHLTQGMPLGILLAAAWVDTLSPQEIASEIDQSLDFLETELRDVPERQRSIRAVFDASWGRLSEAERDVFMKLSVFRGGLLREAAHTVTGATLRTLSGLISKSLLRLDTTGRYEIHELLRQYAAGELDRSGQTDTIREAHSTYYLAFLVQREIDVKGRRQMKGLHEIEADFENVRLAWEWAVAHQHYEIIDQAMEALYWFCIIGNWRQEGQPLFDLARHQLAPSRSSSFAQQRVWGRLLAHILLERNVYRRLDDKRMAQLEQGLAIAKQEAHQAEMGFCLWRLAFAWQGIGDLVKAIRYLEQSLSYYQTQNDLFYRAQVLWDLGACYAWLGQINKFRDCIEQSLDLGRAIGDDHGIAQCLTQLMCVELEIGSQAKIEAYQQEEVTIYRRMGYRHGLAMWLGVRSMLTIYFQGDLEKAKSLANEALEIATDMNASYPKARALHALGLVACLEENYVQSKQFNQAALNASDDWEGTIFATSGLAMAACGLGNYSEVKKYLKDVFDEQNVFNRPAMHPWPKVRYMINFAIMAVVLASEMRLERATELLSLTFNHPSSRNVQAWFKSWPLLTRLRADLEANLSPDVFATAWEKGRTLEPKETKANLLATLEAEADPL